jgi:hypothetical protein
MASGRFVSHAEEAAAVAASIERKAKGLARNSKHRLTC